MCANGARSPDAQGDAPLVDGLDHFLHFPPSPDVSGIDTDAIDDFGRFEGEAMIEVNVGDQRHRHRRLDLRQRSGRGFVRNSDTNDLAAGGFQLLNLLHRRLHVSRIGGTHRLDRNRRITADLD